MEQKFTFNNLPIRALLDSEKQLWFSGIDVCTALEYSNPNQALEKLDEDEKKLASVFQMLGQKRKGWTINESGLYSLILRSSKPEAKVFRKWVTNEVLPSIRKAGIYSNEEVREHELHLQALTKKLESLKQEKDSLQKNLAQIKKQIEETNQELHSNINMNRAQLRIQFPQNNQVE